MIFICHKISFVNHLQPEVELHIKYNFPKVACSNVSACVLHILRGGQLQFDIAGRSRVLRQLQMFLAISHAFSKRK